MKFVRYQPDMEVEREYEEQKPNASLCGAAVLIPEGNALSEDALGTIRHMRYYLNGKGGMALLADNVVALVNVGSVEAMLKEARSQADTALSCMPDFNPYDMDDGCGLLHMINARVYGFKPWRIHPDTCGSLGPALEARQDCLDACEQGGIAALVYLDETDCGL